MIFLMRIELTSLSRIINKKEETLNLSAIANDDTIREDLSEYVAQLQLHMSLQAKNLVPNLHHQVEDSRGQLLHQTQAIIEKMTSRQTIK